MVRYLITAASALVIMSSFAMANPVYDRSAKVVTVTRAAPQGVGYTSTSVIKKRVNPRGKSVVVKKTYKNGISGSSVTRTRTTTNPHTGGTVTRQTTTYR